MRFRFLQGAKLGIYYRMNKRMVIKFRIIRLGEEEISA